MPRTTLPPTIHATLLDTAASLLEQTGISQPAAANLGRVTVWFGENALLAFLFQLGWNGSAARLRRGGRPLVEPLDYRESLLLWLTLQLLAIGMAASMCNIGRHEVAIAPPEDADQSIEHLQSLD